jgi:hypothetical protein
MCHLVCPSRKLATMWYSRVHMFWEIKSVIQFASSFLPSAHTTGKPCVHAYTLRQILPYKKPKIRSSSSFMPLHRSCNANLLSESPLLNSFTAIIFALTKVSAASCQAKMMAANWCEQCQWNLLVVILRFLSGHFLNPLSKMECRHLLLCRNQPNSLQSCLLLTEAPEACWKHTQNSSQRMLLNSAAACGWKWTDVYAADTRTRFFCTTAAYKRHENLIFLVTFRVFVITDSLLHFIPSHKGGRLTTDIVFVQVRCACTCER